MSREAALRPLVVAWLALVALLALTLGLAYIPMGPFNAVAALAIATAKALVVLAVFMELREAPSLRWAFAAAGFFWLAIMFLLSMTDYLTRAAWHGTP